GMGTEAVEVKASYRNSFSTLSVPVLSLFLFLLPHQATAKTPDVQFQQYLTNICFGTYTVPATWNLNELANMCNYAFPGGVAGGVSGPSALSNVGAANAISGPATRKKRGLREREEDQKQKPARGASADDGRWGFLVTPQYGQTSRADTDLENGYHSELAGLVAGLDYRFSDSFVLGGTIGRTKDNAAFVNNAGSLKTGSNTFTLYGTWLASESTAVDGYLGYGKLSTDSRRYVNFGAISGPITSSTTGRQAMAGMSVSYQKDLGRANLSPFINLDYIKTTFNGYSETGTVVPDPTPASGGANMGTSLLALRYGDRSVISFTSSLGARLGTTYSYDWGTLAPGARLATVHEFQNKARQLNNELVLTPGVSMSVATDAADRNYLLSGLGVVAALNGGAQLFLDFEKRMQDRLLNTWSLSLGGLVEF
ncbi:MAG TPA: autotransporter outer membrane beta-barrel domain-containing protein, partial [Sideroxyarcus sp.]|nr:autotransporter outer membrane beta-barrel domain-containing protein [Sideroxyarcus sp.]